MPYGENRKFYPNVQYNSRRRVRYFAMFAILAVLILSMDAWFITSKFWFGLILNVILVFFIVLTPYALRENPTDGKKPVLEVGSDYITVKGKRIARADILKVNAIVYLGSVGNLVENREFLEKAAAEEPPLNMTGSLEFVIKGEKTTSQFAVIEDAVEALALFVREGGAECSLGYSLGKEFRRSTYDLNLIVPAEETAEVSKTKQLL